MDSESFLFKYIQAGQLPGTLNRKQAQLSVIDVGALVDMSPVTYGAGHVPACFNLQSAILTADVAGFEHFDVLDLDLRTTLVGQLQSIPPVHSWSQDKHR